MALADIPGYGAYAQRRQMNEQGGLAELQQAAQAIGFLSNLQKQQKQQSYEEAVAQLGPEASQEQHISLASRFAGPEKVLDIHQKSMDRQDANQARREAAADRRDAQKAMIDARYEQLAQQAVNDDQRRALDARRIEEKSLADKRHDETIRMLAANRPQPQPQIVQTDAGPMQVDRTGKATPIVGPDGTPVAAKVAEKALPTAAAQKLFDNQTNLRRAETALALMEGKDVGAMKGDADATGWKGYVPDAALQRLDPQGTDARAALADLGSLIIHERSGAAVTAAEFPRLQPFIPKINDDPETVKKKLKRFSQIYRDIANETSNFYRESGYKVPELKSLGTAAPAAPAAPAPGGWSITPVPGG